jgi:hypothetical protein
MIKIKKITFLVSILIGFNACDDDIEFLDKEKYVYEIPQVDLTEDVRAGTYYYNYDVEDWEENLAYTPILGEYDPLSPEVLDQQISWAESGGIDFFVFPWNGLDDDNLLNAFQTQAGASNVKMVIGYNTSHLNATNSSPLAGENLDRMLNEWALLAEEHLQKDHYYKVNDRPVIVLSPLNLPSSRSNSIDYPTVVEALRNSLEQLGLNPYIIGELSTGWTAPVNFDEATLRSMDGIVLTNWSTNTYDRAYAFFSYVDLSYQNWKTSLEEVNVEYVPSIFPGYSNPGDESSYVIERSEKNYVSYLNIAKSSMGDSRIVLINSWNDFQKGTSLEPTMDYGTQYLEITKREFDVEE